MGEVVAALVAALVLAWAWHAVVSRPEVAVWLLDTGFC